VNEAKRHLLLTGLKLVDLALVVLSFGLATLLVVHARQGASFTQFFSIRIKLWNFVIFVAALVAWHIAFSLCGMYGSRRLSTRYAQIIDALKATTLSAICLAIVSMLFSISMVTPRFLAFFWVFSFVSVAAGRVMLRYCLGRIRRRGHNIRYMLILGTNQRAIEFAGSVEAKQELGYRILGFVDEDWPQIARFKEARRTLVCNFGGLPEFLRHNVVDEVVSYLPLRSFYEHASQVATLCELHGIILRFNSDIFGLKTARSHAGEFNGHHYITSYPGIRDTWPMMVKRAVDITGSILLRLLLAPLFLVVSLLIKLTSHGPVFFLQERVGYNKRRFLIYKFRTMHPGAEEMLASLESLNEVSGPVFKIKNDPRVTSLGKFLRRASIDELPQLINVLAADMSLVGPRPLPVRDYQGFNKDWQRRRFSVRPGITCLWQVNGRSSITFEEWMKLDLQYMDEWSLWLDLKILARTIPAVLKGSGAT
jgi:exopolysaccharide biosynthesis polyprenyl glycosylphosphotransferase